LHRPLKEEVIASCGEHEELILKIKLPKNMTSAQYEARFKAEKAQLQRHYCTVFKFWRSCPYKPCRKVRACAGDQHTCLKENANGVPRDVHWHARQQLLKSTPPNVGAPERLARGLMPGELYE
jgi:hypothetical protein